MSRAITIAESKTLIELEKVIEHGKLTFLEVGTALAKIKTDKLFENDFDTFEDYCRDRWGWKKAYVNHVMRAADTIKGLPESTATIVATESQARELSKVPAEKRAEVVEIAASRAKSESRPMTAADITQAALPAPDWEAKANERLAARNATEATAPDGYSVLKDRVEREFHKFMDKFEASELPEVRRIIRPWVVRS